MTNAAKEDPKNEGIFNLSEPTTLMVYIKNGEHPLFTPRPFIGKNGKPQGEPKYGGELIFSSESLDLAAIKAHIAKVARAKWPDKPFSEMALPLSDGTKKADKGKTEGKDRENLRGKVVLKCQSKYAPRLSYIDPTRGIVDLENEAALVANKGKFYAGVEVLAQLNFVPYDAIGENTKPGVTAYLNIVLSTNKGAKLAGGQTATEAFKGYVGKMSVDDPTAGPGATENLDDVISF